MKSLVVPLLLALLAMTVLPAADAALGPVVAAGTGKSLQDGACRNTHVIEGASPDGATWTFTVATESRFVIGTSVVLFPCPWVPAGEFVGAWNPSVGGTIPHAGGAGSLSLTLSKASSALPGGTAYTLRVCIAGLCSSAGGSADLVFARP